MCLKEVFDTLDRPVTIVDREGRFVYYNRASARMDGIDGDHLIGRHVLDVNPWLRPEDSTLLACLHDYARFTDSMQMFIGPGGQLIPYLHTVMPLFGRSGDLIGAIEIGREARFSRVSPGELPLILTADPVMQQEISRVDIFGASELPILIYGETGTGKELFARRAHAASPRAGRPMVSFNCAAIPDTLLESTLFGTVRGAFTGAENKKGLFTQAEGGTLFLDEINSMPVNLQSKLLRVLQDGSFLPLGSQQAQVANVRLIAALNEPPRSAMAAGRLREDLYYRLNVGYIHIPPLRERQGDVVLLAQAFVARYAAGLQPEVTRLADAAAARLVAHDWPGNVRELENVIRRSLLLHPGGTALADVALLDDDGPTVPATAAAPAGPPADAPLQDWLDDEARQVIRAALDECHGNVSAAARQLGLPRTTLISRCQRLGV
ncbi:sigma 54-interacting transcriptional regulator [Laribacter hongkongensis]|uniref:Sigma 54-interacting transcriptional regulator n=2 Tax=Laribacter hongkongensis TaxID=168471 RepID=A0ABD4SU56_9NEIS|nr:sigma 54-interacting transcriptional regulator [Laribacter hongkongensis]MCG9101836.1 sigma 54-interacting transcriptional regulator [Laribacter hongkongensis]MCG9103884.1 sigma 54-interacting transcriptional regulator [Laribacter hongkongensis]MCG9113882.1 sigma 54-interacting transcriptional regulator [Laribacter hongkongensis]MCG9118679.1 sigma 54-interacting transcriptional regulator [Laribacter hongkongensis]